MKREHRARAQGRKRVLLTGQWPHNWLLYQVEAKPKAHTQTHTHTIPRSQSAKSQQQKRTSNIFAQHLAKLKKKKK